MKACIVDTNLLLLFIVGSTSKEYITKHKRLNTYTEEDYDLLLALIKQASDVICTPNILTEASSFLRQGSEPMRSAVYKKFSQMILSSLESYTASKIAVEQKEFFRLGLTDAVLLADADKTITLITDDFDLYRASLERGNSVINFNHYRTSIFGF